MPPTKKPLTRQAQRNEEIKQALIAHGYVVARAAEALGMEPNKLSEKLNHRSLYPWWSRRKKKLSQERLKAKRKRSNKATYEKRKSEVEAMRRALAEMQRDGIPVDEYLYWAK